MADNQTAKNASGQSFSFRATDNSSIYTPHTVLEESGGAEVGYVDNTAFTEGTSGILAGLAGLYDTAATVLTSGRVGLARLTARRAVVTAADYSILTLTSGTPVPSGSDILDDGGSAIVGGDLDIRDTNNHWFAIPMVTSGWKNIYIGVSITAAFDATITFDVYVSSTRNPYAYGKLFSTTAGSGNFAIGPGLPGLNGQIGDNTATTGDWFPVGAMGNCIAPYVMFKATAGTTPTTGAMTLYITRST